MKESYQNGNDEKFQFLYDLIFDKRKIRDLLVLQKIEDFGTIVQKRFFASCIR